MDPTVFLGADPAAQVLFSGILAAILVGTALKLVGGQRWDDWLDERWGRGSVRDDWPLSRINGTRRRPDG